MTFLLYMNLLSSTYLLLIFILGIISTSVLSIPLSKKGKFLIGPALGIILITTLTLLISFILGFNNYSIIISALLFFTVTKVCTKSKLSFEIKTGIRTLRTLRTFGTHWPFLIILATIGTVTFYVFWNQVLAPNQFGDWVTGGGGMWGDTAMHTSYTMSLVEQGLPPQNPLFAGQPLVYPFLVNFFSAILVKLGSNLRFAFILPQLAYFMGFLALFYKVGKKFTNNLGVFFAMLIFFLGWGLGFTRYMQDSLNSGIWTVTREYTNNLPGFFMHNVLTGLIFPERSLLPGLFIGMLITFLYLNLSFPSTLSFPLKRESLILNLKSLIFIGLLLGTLPLWHTHSFLFFGFCVGFWIFFQPTKLRNKPAIIEKIFSLIILYGLAGIISLPIFIWFAKQVTHAAFFHLTLGWMETKNNPLLFWFNNSGFLIPLAIIGIFLMNKKKGIVFFFLPVFLIFIIANFIMFSPWDWDNIKLLSWVFLFLAIPAGHALANIMTVQKGSHPLFIILKSLIFIPILISLTASGTLSLIQHLPHTFTIYDKSDQNMADWVKINTKQTDVFLIDPQPTNPLPGLTGRSAYLGYPGHLWVHGINYYNREQQAKAIINGDLTQLKNLEVPVQYLLVSSSSKILFINHPQLTLVFENPKYTIYQLQ